MGADSGFPSKDTLDGRIADLLEALPPEDALDMLKILVRSHQEWITRADEYLGEISDFMSGKVGATGVLKAPGFALTQDAKVRCGMLVKDGTVSIILSDGEGDGRLTLNVSEKGDILIDLDGRLGIVGFTDGVAGLSLVDGDRNTVALLAVNADGEVETEGLTAEVSP